MAEGKAKTPDPAISPAKKMEAVTMPNPLTLLGIATELQKNGDICTRPEHYTKSLQAKHLRHKQEEPHRF